MKVGFGYDLHPFMDGRKLILGGVDIPYKMGLKGHSDADVLCHAIMDALLGAAALGDIGEHFPDTDPAYKDMSSLLLLEKVVKKIVETGFTIINVDVTIVAEAPKMSPYKEKMVKNIADIMGVNSCSVNIKATTNEGFGSVGRSEVIVAYAVASIESKIIPEL